MAFCVRSKILDEERTMAVDNELARLSTPVSARDHAEGSEGAVVTLVEYGDYECPHCGRAYPIVKEIQKRLGSRLRFVFRNFPLVQIHPHAQHAAEAAEAAALQGKFWEMHDVIFEHQQALDERHLTEYAAGLGLDQARFQHELTSHTHATRVREDFLSGIKSGVNGTPTFFINGIRHDDSWDIDTLEEALTRASRTKS
jgi:protein-disulfide isomerase